MTQANESNLMAQLLEMVGKDGTDSLLNAFHLLLNEAMRLERGHALGALPHERTEGRQGHANGFKDKTLKTRLGEGGGAGAQREFRTGALTPPRKRFCSTRGMPPRYLQYRAYSFTP